MNAMVDALASVFAMVFVYFVWWTVFETYRYLIWREDERERDTIKFSCIVGLHGPMSPRSTNVSRCEGCGCDFKEGSFT